MGWQTKEWNADSPRQQGDIKKADGGLAAVRMNGLADTNIRIADIYPLSRQAGRQTEREDRINGGRTSNRVKKRQKAALNAKQRINRH